MERKNYESLEGDALIAYTKAMIDAFPETGIYCPVCQKPICNVRSISSVKDYITNSIGFLCFNCETYFVIFNIGKTLYQKLEVEKPKRREDVGDNSQ